jgi:hypothetical protein
MSMSDQKFKGRKENLRRAKTAPLVSDLNIRSGTSGINDHDWGKTGELVPEDVAMEHERT